MSDETTTKQLAEIEGQAEDTPATKYTPPDGWRVLAVGEVLQAGDMWVWPTDDQMRQTLHAGAVVGANQRYIRRIEPQPEPQPQPEPASEPQAESDAELRIRLLQQANDSQAETIGRLQAAIDERADLDTGDQTRVELQARIRELETVRDTQAATIEELRSEVYYVQNLLGESRQRVKQLEQLVASLRTINEGAEKAVSGAGVVNDSLRLQLAAVKAELATKAETSRRLQMELDAAQQVPADSPELRQLRLDLAEVTQDRDTYRDGYDRVLSDLRTIRETAKAEAVEAIVEWLVPVRLADSAYLANATMQHLPSIMRHLTGLTQD